LPELISCAEDVWQTMVARAAAIRSFICVSTD
jgi:hypothetical protein